MENNEVNDAWNRVMDLILEDTPQTYCPNFISGCDYIQEQRKKGNINLIEQGHYHESVCLKYPGACEKNLENPSFKFTKLKTLDEIHELLR